MNKLIKNLVAIALTGVCGYAFAQGGYGNKDVTDKEKETGSYTVTVTNKTDQPILLETLLGKKQNLQLGKDESRDVPVTVTRKLLREGNYVPAAGERIVVIKLADKLLVCKAEDSKGIKLETTFGNPSLDIELTNNGECLIKS